VLWLERPVAEEPECKRRVSKPPTRYLGSSEFKLQRRRGRWQDSVQIHQQSGYPGLRADESRWTLGLDRDMLARRNGLSAGLAGFGD
jgi:hypothetical protein